MKRIIVFALLVCMIAGNSDRIYKDYQNMNPDYTIKLDEIFNMAIIYDMKREFIMLGVSLGLFLGARSVNNWLDRCEQEEAEIKKQEEDAKLLRDMQGKPVDEDESESEEAETKKTK